MHMHARTRYMHTRQHMQCMYVHVVCMWRACGMCILHVMFMFMYVVVHVHDAQAQAHVQRSYICMYACIYTHMSTKHNVMLCRACAHRIPTQKAYYVVQYRVISDQ